MIKDNMTEANEDNVSLVLSTFNGSNHTGSYHSGTSLVSRDPSVDSARSLSIAEGERYAYIATRFQT